MTTNDNDTSYELSAEFSVSPDKLFRAFLDEETLRRIWGVSSISVDARPNGQARAQLEINGERWDFTITYLEVVPAETLRWVVRFDRFPGKEIRVALRFKAVTDGSRLDLRMENFESSQERDSNRGAWVQALSTLRELLADQ